MADAEDGERITTLAQQLELDKATVHRLLDTLRQHGYVQQNADTQKYYLTLKLWTLGSKVVERRSITEAARPILRSLLNDGRDMVYLSVLVGADAIILDKVEGRDTIQKLPKVGARIPLYACSPGKAILGFQDENFINSIIGDGLLGFTSATIIDPSRLLAELAHIRNTGYAVNRDELRVGVSGIAAPIRSESREVDAAIAIAVPSVRLTSAHENELSGMLITAAHTIEAQLGSSSD